MNNRPSSPDDELSLSDLFSILWSRKGLIVMTTAAVGAALASVAAFLPKTYEARIVLSPVTTQSNNSAAMGAGSTLSQLGSLASMAGLSISSAGGSRSETLATLQSEALTELYIDQHNLLPILFSRKWDASAKAWKDLNTARVPTRWQGNEFFARKVRALTENSKTGLVTLNITWRDPHLAALWANGLVELTNDYLKSRAIAESQRNIAYLNAAAAQTSVIELRNAISSLMEVEIRKQMLAKGSDEYALKVIDPAVAPEKATGPSLVRWLIGGLALGFVISVAFALVARRRGPT